MYEVSELWKEVVMEARKESKPTDLQVSIFEFCEQHEGIVALHDIYMDYTLETKCSRDYFYDVVSTRWSVFKEDGTIWVDLNTPFGDSVWTLESSLQSS